MAIILNDNLRINAPKPNDERYLRADGSVWTDVAEVNANIVPARRHIGLAVLTAAGEYWYEAGILDTDLVQKTGGALSGNGITVGTISSFASPAAVPTNYLILTGTLSSKQEVSKTAYAQLYAVLGDVYGVPTNPLNFVLPSADGLLMKGGNVVDYFSSGGSDTLSESQLPSHTHSLIVSNNLANSDEGFGNYITTMDVGGGPLMSSLPIQLETTNSASIGNTGSGLPHQHPYQKTIFAICYESVGIGSATPTPNLDQVTTVGNTTSNNIIISNGAGLSNVLDSSGFTISNGTSSTQAGAGTLGLSSELLNNVVLRENGVGTVGTYDVYFRRLSGTVALLDDLTNLALGQDGQGISFSAGQFNIGGGLQVTGNRIIDVASGSPSLSFNQNTGLGGYSRFGVSGGSAELRGTGDGTYNSRFYITSNGTASILSNKGGFGIDISFDGDRDDAFRIDSNRAGFQGATYTQDYSTNFTLRSLVDKGYVDGLLSSLGTFKGGWDASLGTTPTGATVIAGDYYRITVAGTLTGLLSGDVNVQVGDVIVANISNPISNSDWFALQSNFEDSRDILVGGAFAPLAGTILGSDDVKTALEKLQGNIGQYVPLAGNNFLNPITGNFRLENDLDWKIEKDNTSVGSNEIIHFNSDGIWTRIVSPFDFTDNSLRVERNSIFMLSNYNDIGNSVNVTSYVQTSAGGVFLSNRDNSNLENRLEFGADTLYNNGQTTKTGIRYVGFGELDVDGTSADYSNLVGTSLVPKKFVQDYVNANAVNIYNSDGVLTATRTLDANSNSLNLNNLTSFYVQVANGGTGNMVVADANNYVSHIVEQDGFVSRVTSTAKYSGDPTIEAVVEAYATNNSNGYTQMYYYDPNIGVNNYVLFDKNKIEIGASKNTDEFSFVFFPNIATPYAAFTDNSSTKTGILLGGFGGSDLYDTLGTANYSTLANNSLVPKKWVIDYVSGNSPIFLDETSTIADFQAGNTYFYIGEAPITYDYDLEPYPLPVPASSFNFVNLSVFDVTFNSDGANTVYTLKPQQALRDVQFNDIGVWQLNPTEYIDNIYNLNQVTDKGNSTFNAIFVRNNPDTYRTRYSTIGQQLQYDLGGYNINYDNLGVSKLTQAGSKSWNLQLPDLTANTNSTSYTVDFRPNVSGTVAYLSDIPVSSGNIYTIDGTLTGDRVLDTGIYDFSIRNLTNTNNKTYDFTLTDASSNTASMVMYVTDSLSKPTVSLGSNSISQTLNSSLEVGSTFGIFSPTAGNAGTAGISLVSGGLDGIFSVQSEFHLSHSQGLVYVDTTLNTKGIRYFGFNETDFNGTNANYSTLVSNSLVPKKYVDDLLSTPTSTSYLDPVISQTNTPPLTPTTGDRYLIGTAPTGVWSANAENIAEWNGTSWVFTAPVLDNVVFVTDVLTTYRYNGADWVAYVGTAILQNGNTLGGTMIVGTRDNQEIRLIQNNTQFARVNTSKQLILADNVTAFTPFDANSTLEISADGPKAKLRVTRFSSNTTAPLFEGYKARGTVSAPLDAIAGDSTFSYLGQARVNGTFQLVGTANMVLSAISGTNQPIGGFNIPLANGAGSTTTNFSLLNTSTVTSGAVNMSLLGGFSFAPTSGTATASLLGITGTINQTGGANGVTRGIYVNPTLTAASDFRGIEINSSAIGLKLTNSTTGTTPTDGSDISLNGLVLQIRNREASSIELYTNNTLRATLQSGGNLGIGTTTINAKTVISGNSDDTGGIRFQDLSSVDRLAIFPEGASSASIKNLVVGGALSFQNSVGTKIAELTTGVGTESFVFVNGFDLVWKDNSGTNNRNVLTYDSSNNVILNNGDANGNISLVTSTNGSINFNTNGVNKYSILTNGDLNVATAGGVNGDSYRMLFNATGASSQAQQGYILLDGFGTAGNLTSQSQSMNIGLLGDGGKDATLQIYNFELRLAGTNFQRIARTGSLELVASVNNNIHATSGSIIFSTVSTSTTRASISNAGVFNIANLAGTGSRIVQTDASGNLSAGALVSSFATTALNSGQILVGNASNVATATTMSGDANLSNTGVLTIANNAVSNAKLAQMPAYTVKSNPTNATANAQDLALTANSVLGRFTGDLQPVAMVDAFITDGTDITNFENEANWDSSNSYTSTITSNSVQGQRYLGARYLYYMVTNTTVIRQARYLSNVAVLKTPETIAVNAKTTVGGTYLGNKTIIGGTVVQGTTFKVMLEGLITSNTSNSMTFNVAVGSVEVPVVVPINNTSDQYFSAEFTLTFNTTGTAGKFRGQGRVFVESGIYPIKMTANSADIDTDANFDLNVNTQFSAGSNSIVVTNYVITRHIV